MDDAATDKRFPENFTIDLYMSDSENRPVPLSEEIKTTEEEEEKIDRELISKYNDLDDSEEEDDDTTDYDDYLEKLEKNK